MKKITLLIFFLLNILVVQAQQPVAGDYVFTGDASTTAWSGKNWSISNGSGGYTSTGVANPNNTSTSAGVWIPEGKIVTGQGACKGCRIYGTLTTSSSSFSIDGDLYVSGIFNIGGTCRFKNAEITSTGKIIGPTPLKDVTSSPASIYLKAGYTSATGTLNNDPVNALTSAQITNNGVIKYVFLAINQGCKKMTLTGNPVEVPQLEGISPDATVATVAQEIVIDQNVNMVARGTGVLKNVNDYYGAVLSLSSGTSSELGDDTKITGDKVFTLNAGKTITFADSIGSFHAKPYSTIDTGTPTAHNYVIAISSIYGSETDSNGKPNGKYPDTEKWTYNINGTLDATKGNINLCTNVGDSTRGTNRLIVNISNTGIIKCGKFVRWHQGIVDASPRITLNNNGTILYSEPENYYTTSICAPGAGDHFAQTNGKIEKKPLGSPVEVTNSLISAYQPIASGIKYNKNNYFHCVVNKDRLIINNLKNNDVVSIYSVIGQKFTSNIVSNNQISINLKSGIYLVHVVSGVEKYVAKVIVH